VAFAVLGVDFLVRLRLAWDEGRERWSLNVVMKALLWFGSDAANGPGEDSVVLSMGSGVILLISLCLANLLDTPALALLRANPGGPVQGLTALACVACLFKLLIGIYIAFYFKAPLAETDEQKQQRPKGLQEQQQQPSAGPAPAPALRASQRVSFDVAYGGAGAGADPIPSPGPKRLQAAPSADAARRGSAKTMTDNLLRPSQDGHRLNDTLKDRDRDRAIDAV
jgi:hypothetical protein